MGSPSRVVSARDSHQKICASDANRTHGMSLSSEYRIWIGVKNRCQNPRNKRYDDYGGRGITVCERWQKFENFLEDMGPRPSKQHSLDREDNSKGYCKENCRWVTTKDQNRNTRRNRILEINGVSRCLAEWCEIAGVNHTAVLKRLRRGLSAYDSVFGKWRYSKKD